MITQDNIARHELIGLQATVTGSANAQLVGTTGLVVDETRNMLTLDTPTGLKSVPKGINEWRFRTAAGQDTHIKGSRITRRSAGRLVTRTS